MSTSQELRLLVERRCQELGEDLLVGEVDSPRIRSLVDVAKILGFTPLFEYPGFFGNPAKLTIQIGLRNEGEPIVGVVLISQSVDFHLNQTEVVMVMLISDQSVSIRATLNRQHSSGIPGFSALLEEVQSQSGLAEQLGVTVIWEARLASGEEVSGMNTLLSRSEIMWFPGSRIFGRK